MENKLTKSDYILATLSLLGILIFIYFYHQLFPWAGINLELSKQQIENKALQMTVELDYDVSGYKKIVNFKQDPDQVNYLVRQYGAKEAISLMKEQLPAYYWEIRWKSPNTYFDDSTKAVKVSSGNDKKPSVIFKITLSTNGKILSILSNFDQKTEKTLIDKDSTFKKAETLLKKFEGQEFDNYIFSNSSGDTSFTFSWKRIEPLWGEKIEIEIQTHGGRVEKYEKEFSPPEEILSISKATKFVEIPTIIILFFFIIFIIIILVQKLRRDEISVKSGIGLTILVVLAFLVKFLFSNYQATLIEILLPPLIISIFVILSLFAIIGTGESLCREVWPEKLITFDALRKFRILFPLVSKSILRGIALAFLSLGIITILLKIFTLNHGFCFIIEETNISAYFLLVPFLYVLSSALLTSSYSELIFRLFSISFLKKKISSNLVIIVISAFIWAFNFMEGNDTILIPVYLHIIKNFIIGVLFAYFFIKYDFVTVLFGSFFLKLIRETYPMLFWGDTFIMWNGVFLWIFLGFFVIAAVLGFKKKIDQQSVSQYIPPYIKRMQERERVKRELEIARKVQLSFLPREVPQIPGIDVATICIPAYEVGGDYYDFIEPGNGRFGVVIGDVSGKGIPAAFHMTLTKGFLKSQAKETSSPRELLMRLNELFYENVSRGTFISMIFGIFDLPRKIFTFARAGHNPVIIRSDFSNKMEFLCPKGIALGLEKGPIFNRVIEEQKVKIRKGDIFIFYTDGISEAMNEKKWEFGEERLQTIINKNSNVLANELVTIIQSKISEFVGNTPQHDDLTMIIVKIM